MTPDFRSLCVRTSRERGTREARWIRREREWRRRKHNDGRGGGNRKHPHTVFIFLFRLISLLFFFCLPAVPNRLGSVDTNDIADLRPAERAVTTTFTAPLLDRAGITHAHVAAHVEHAVNTALVANGALAQLARERRLQALAPLLQVG